MLYHTIHSIFSQFLHRIYPEEFLLFIAAAGEVLGVSDKIISWMTYGYNIP